MRVPKPTPPGMGSIEAACARARVSKAEFYRTWMPRVRSTRVGQRRWIDLASVDEVVDEAIDQVLAARNVRM